MRFTTVAVFVIGFALAGCNSATESPAYQLITAQDGKLFRLNSQTGETYLVTDSGLVQLTDKWPMLQVGEYYQMADAKTDEKFLKYLGDGRFEKGKWAIKKVRE